MAGKASSTPMLSKLCIESNYLIYKLYFLVPYSLAACPHGRSCHPSGLPLTKTTTWQVISPLPSLLLSSQHLAPSNGNNKADGLVATPLTRVQLPPRGGAGEDGLLRLGGLGGGGGNTGSSDDSCETNRQVNGAVPPSLPLALPAAQSQKKNT